MLVGVEGVEQLSAIFLTLVTLNGVADAELPDAPEAGLEEGVVPELEGFDAEPLDEELEDPLVVEVPLLAEEFASLPLTRTWCPTSSLSLEVSPCS